MSVTNGEHSFEASRTKAIVDALKGWTVGELDQLRATVQKSLSNIEQVQRSSSVTRLVQENLVDTAPIALVMEKVEANRSIDRTAEAMDKARHLAVVKDLVDAVNNLPVPTVGGTVVDNSEVAAALRELAALVLDRPLPVVEAPDMSALYELVELNARTADRLVSVLDRLDETMGRLVEAVTKKREKRRLRFTEDGVVEE